MFNQILAGATPPTRPSFDSDPLCDFQQWKANLRVLEIAPICSVPHVFGSHPFVERLIGTIRREYLDHLFFWNARDLERKLDEFRIYFNEVRVHSGIGGTTPDLHAELAEARITSLDYYRWQSRCQGLVEMPEAA